MRYFVYGRKSTDTSDKQLQSLETQNREVLNYAKRHNLTIVGTYEEKMSAMKAGRPVYSKMIKDIEAGKADGLLCYRMDRLARNMKDGGALIDLLQKGTLKEIRTPEKTYKTSDEVYSIIFSMAQANEEVRTMIKRVKDSNKTILLKGGWPRLAPFGYLNNKIKKTIEQDKDRAPLIAEMFEMYASGKYSYQKITDILYTKGLRNKGGNKVYKSRVESILKNPFYYGMMLSNGILYSGNHTPITTKETFDTCAEVMNPKTHTRSKKHFYHLRSPFFTCEECGCAITAQKQKGTVYYNCTNGKGMHKKVTYNREESIDEQITKHFYKLKFDTELIEIMYQAAKEKMSTETDSSTETVQRLQKQLTTLEKRESTLLDIYLDGKIPEDTYNSKSLTLQNNKTNLQHQIKQLKQKTTDPLSTLELTKQVFLTSNRAVSKYIISEPREKYNILSELLSNRTLQGNNIAQLSFKTPYNILAKTSKNSDFQTLQG